MEDFQISEQIGSAFRSLKLPKYITSRFEVFRLSDLNDGQGLLHLVSKRTGKYAFWVVGKVTNKEQTGFSDRRAVGATMGLREFEQLDEKKAKRLLRSMVKNFLKQAQSFPEGGRYPKPINASEYLS